MSGLAKGSIDAMMLFVDSDRVAARERAEKKRADQKKKKMDQLKSSPLGRFIVESGPDSVKTIAKVSGFSPEQIKKWANLGYIPSHFACRVYVGMKFANPSSSVSWEEMTGGDPDKLFLSTLSSKLNEHQSSNSH